MTRNLPLALILAALVALALPSVAAACAGADLTPGQQGARAAASTTLCLLNAERAKTGARPLRAQRVLARVGRGHAADMVRNQYFSHSSLDGRDPLRRIKMSGYGRGKRHVFGGETLAWGRDQWSTPRSIVADWMNSPPHRDAILFRSFREAGLAVVDGSPRGGAGATYAAIFGG